MSLGIGVGDIIKLSECAWGLYKAYKESSADFAQLTADVLSLHAILTEISEFLSENGDQLDTSRLNRLAMVTGPCEKVLKDMEALYLKYDSLGTQQQRTWDRLKYGLKDLSELRRRLITSVTNLTAWFSIVLARTTRLEKKLDKFISEVRGGLREKSVASAPDAAQAIESPDVWFELRRELEDVGISPAVLEEKKDYILGWLKQVLSDGGLDETCNDAAPKLPPYSLEPPTSDMTHPSFGEQDASSLHVGNGNHVSSGLPLTTANDAFEEELKRQHLEWPLDAKGSGDHKQGTSFPDRVAIPSIKIRRRTDPVVMIKKLFKNNTDIIEAASDGDLERVAKLISLGMDVNARERWGWSALSMCGYGGHREIARILLDHGADLDNVDVDGDTPGSLAAQRGHTELVIMFDEEREARDRRVREMG